MALKNKGFPSQPSYDKIDKCPQCGYIQHCPCSTCIKDIPEGEKTWVWVDGDVIKCVQCGFTAHIDYWLDWEFACYQMKGIDTNE